MNTMITQTVTTEALQRLSAKQAWRYRSLPYKEDSNFLYLFVDEAVDRPPIQEELKLIIGKPIDFTPVSSQEISSALSKYYRGNSSNVSIGKLDSFFKDIVLESLSVRASDIHLEALADKGRVRLRIDGSLVERYEIPKERYGAIVNQIKVKAALDISQKRLPQDGRIAFKDNGEEKCDVRVSILPTLHGEKVVMRLLNRSAIDLSLESLGFEKQQLTIFRKGLAAKTGLVLVSGPTGSGKTTTLYAAMKSLNLSDRNLLTIEDPVEYTLRGINQVQLHEDIGLTFPEAMRAFLRQDPNVLMVGEIRDAETAEMAIRLSLTGHLVLSTIHTNSAWGIVTRLKDMGIEPFLIAETLRVAVAQRLVRRLCKECASSTDVSSLHALNVDLGKLSTVLAPVGCPSCQYTGYKGRVAVHETIEIGTEESDAIRTEGNRPSRLGQATMRSRILNLLEKGTTSIEEATPWLLDI